MSLILKKLPVCYKILVTKRKICTGFNILEVMLQMYKVLRTLAGDKLEVFEKIYYSPSKSSVYERVLRGNCLRTGPKEFFFFLEFLKKLGQGIQNDAKEIHKLFKVLATVKCACEL
jgi:hypothetical protein